MARCTRLIISCLILAISLDAFCALNAEDDPTLDVIRSQDEEERDPILSRESLHCITPKTNNNKVTVLSGDPYHLSSMIRVQCPDGLQFSNGMSDVTLGCSPVPDPCMCVVFWQSKGNAMFDFNCTESLQCKNPKTKNNTVTVLSGDPYHMGNKIQVQCLDGLHFGNGLTNVTVRCEPAPHPCMCIALWSTDVNLMNDLNCTGNYGPEEPRDGRDGVMDRDGLDEEVRERKLDNRNSNDGIREDQRRAVGEENHDASEFPETSIETNESPANVETSELVNEARAREETSGELGTSETSVETNHISSTEENIGEHIQEEIKTDESETPVSSVETDETPDNEEQSNFAIEEPLQEETIDDEVPETTGEINEIPEIEEQVEHHIEEPEDTEHEEEFPIYENEEVHNLEETEPLQQPPVLMENTDDVNDKEPDFGSEFKLDKEEEHREEHEIEEENEDIPESSENEHEFQSKEEDGLDNEQEEQEVIEHQRENEQVIEAEEFEYKHEHDIQEEEKEEENQDVENEEHELSEIEMETPEDNPEHEHVGIHEEEEQEEHEDSGLPHQNEFEENNKREETENEIEEYEPEEALNQYQEIDEENVERETMLEEEARDMLEETEELEEDNSLPYESNYLETEESDNELDTAMFDWAAISSNNAEEYEEMTNEIGQLDNKAQLRAAQLFKYQTSLQQPEQLKGGHIILDAILDPLSKQEDEEEEEEFDGERVVEEQPEMSEEGAEDVESPGWFTDIQQKPVGESPDTRPPSETGAVCSLPPETGPCRMYLQRYFFNSITKECDLFVYGGCNGNGNNFESLRDCINSCLKDTRS